MAVAASDAGPGMLDVNGVADFLMQSFPAAQGSEFRATLHQVQVLVDGLTGQRRAARAVHKAAGEWGPRVIAVFDLDGSGELDRGEFNLIYDCVEAQQRDSVEVAYQRYQPIDAAALGRYLASTFSSVEELTAAVMMMMERGNIMAQSKRQLMERSSRIGEVKIEASLPSRSPTVEAPSQPEDIAVEVSPLIHTEASVEEEASLDQDEDVKDSLAKLEPAAEVVIDIQEAAGVSQNATASQTEQAVAGGGGLAPACTPELLHKIDEILPGLFDRSASHLSLFVNGVSPILCSGVAGMMQTAVGPSTVPPSSNSSPSTSLSTWGCGSSRIASRSVMS